LQEGRLLFSAEQKRVYFKDEAGRLFDAMSGTPAASAPSDLDEVRRSNRIRIITRGHLWQPDACCHPIQTNDSDAAQACAQLSPTRMRYQRSRQAIAKETITHASSAH